MSDATLALLVALVAIGISGVCLMLIADIRKKLR